MAAVAARWSPGSFIILDIEKERRFGLPHVYLGYLVEGSKKWATTSDQP